MIVNYKESGWEIITQRAHGLLAAQLAMHWKVSGRPKRWMETLLAIAEHDDAEVELDGENLLTSKGGPLNFDMKKFDPVHCTRLSQLSITKSRYIALLTSMHMDFLYGGEVQTNAQAAKFLKEQKKKQDEWRLELGISKDESERIYSFLEWCDAFSLLLCQQLLQPEQRSVEISKGPDNIKYQLFQLPDNKLTIQPWPFEPASFSIWFESRTIPQLQFKDSAEFRTAFNSAVITEISWELSKARVPDKTRKTKL